MDKNMAMKGVGGILPEFLSDKSYMWTQKMKFHKSRRHWEYTRRRNCKLLHNGRSETKRYDRIYCLDLGLTNF